MIYRCEDPVLSAKFARATEAAAFYVISMRKYEAAVAGGSVENPYHEATYERAYFANAIGQVSLVIGKDGTYLDFYRKHEGSAEKTESGRTFFSFSNIYPALLEVKAEIASQCVVMD